MKKRRNEAQYIHKKVLFKTTTKKTTQKNKKKKQSISGKGGINHRHRLIFQNNELYG